MLERAKETLSSFAFVGITERYSEALRLFEGIFLRTPIRFFYLRNASPASLSPGVSERVQRLLAEACALDIALYDHACKLFDQQIARCPGFAGVRPPRMRRLPRPTV